MNHWAAACPDGQYFTEVLPEHDMSIEYTDDDPHQVTLFQSNLVTGDCMKIFVAESMCSAILDSGATATVSGKN